ncbi:MAG: NAD(P)-binding protein [Magnetococcales bacterium]|nr:NAD(P)-binding protein [Magnetococcales bacterium]
MADIPSNPYLKSAKEWDFKEFIREPGDEKHVAYGDASGKCPTYVKRTPPCTDSCPAGEDIRGYNNIIRGVWQTDNPWEAAFYRLANMNPFPAVMGRVCPAPCQGGCNRQYRDETIGINSIEHAIGQYAVENNLGFEKPTTQSGKKIAVVGSGPGGLSFAYQMAKRGHAVTIYERDGKLGGMMRYGIMGYRVNREVMDKEIQRILDLGVEVRLNTRIGTDITLDQLSKDFDAVFVAVGAQSGRGLPIPGADNEGCTNAIEFLREFELQGGIEDGGAERMKVGKHVVVIGDGDVAMDVARLALRLGSKATLLSGVAREEMNCSKFEFDEALAEGTDIKFQTGSVEVIAKDGRAAGIKIVNMVKKDKGEDGWNHPVPFFRYKTEEGTESEIECDMVVAAIGQGTDMSGLEACTNDTPWLQVDHNYKVKGLDNVFGGGDAVQIHLLTTAIGHGRKAAEAMDMLINGIPLPAADRDRPVKYEKLKWDFFAEKAQKKRTITHPSIVKGNWDETLSVLQNEDVVEEADRCMSCGLCFECNQCMLFCPQDAIVKFKGNPEGEVMFTHYERCVGCHICAEICPTGFIDMAMGH